MFDGKLGGLRHKILEGADERVFAKLLLLGRNVINRTDFEDLKLKI